MRTGKTLSFDLQYTALLEILCTRDDRNASHVVKRALREYSENHYPDIKVDELGGRVIDRGWA